MLSIFSCGRRLYRTWFGEWKKNLRAFGAAIWIAKFIIGL